MLHCLEFLNSLTLPDIKGYLQGVPRDVGKYRLGKVDSFIHYQSISFELIGNTI